MNTKKIVISLFIIMSLFLINGCKNIDSCIEKEEYQIAYDLCEKIKDENEKINNKIKVITAMLGNNKYNEAIEICRNDVSVINNLYLDALENENYKLAYDLCENIIFIFQCI